MKRFKPKTSIPRRFSFVSPGPEVKFGQHVIPRDNKLLKKIGVRPGSRILIFAGGFGDWANQLGRYAKIEYSDITQEMAEWVGAYQKRIKKHFVADAMTIPKRKRKYDYSFSFEPTIGSQALSGAMQRALLNNVGCIIIEREGFTSLFGTDIRALMQSISRIYGARYEERQTIVKGIFHTQRVKNGGRDKIEEIPLVTYCLFTNDSARRLAELDLLMEKLLRERQPTKANAELVPVIRNMLRKSKITIGALEQSLQRIRDLKNIIKG